MPVECPHCGGWCGSICRYDEDYFGSYQARQGSYEYKNKYKDEFSYVRQERERQKRIRLDKAVLKDCAGCEKEMPHDPEDYLCIVCRDGNDALPQVPRSAEVNFQPAA